MSEITTAANNIYNRLRTAPAFHPANAELFTDWNVQAGDVITVQSDGESYSVPVYSMKLKWTGAPKVSVESTGNPERAPIPEIKRREYAENSANHKETKRASGAAGSALEKTAEINGILYAAGLQIDPVTGVWLYASERGADYALGSSFRVQADAITAEVTRATAAEGEMGSRITQTAEAITAEVARATASEGTLSSRITQTAEAITSEVSRATSAEASMNSRITQTADSITSEVTARTNGDQQLSSRITQTANEITLKANKVTVDALQTSISNLTTGATTAQYLKANAINSPSGVINSLTTKYNFNYKDEYVYWRSATVKGSDGSNITIHYLGN